MSGSDRSVWPRPRHEFTWRRAASTSGGATAILMWTRSRRHPLRYTLTFHLSLRLDNRSPRGPAVGINRPAESVDRCCSKQCLAVHRVCHDQCLAAYRCAACRSADAKSPEPGHKQRWSILMLVWSNGPWSLCRPRHERGVSRRGNIGRGILHTARGTGNRVPDRLLLNPLILPPNNQPSLSRS